MNYFWLLRVFHYKKIKIIFKKYIEKYLYYPSADFLKLELMTKAMEDGVKTRKR